MNPPLQTRAPAPDQNIMHVYVGRDTARLGQGVLCSRAPRMGPRELDACLLAMNWASYASVIRHITWSCCWANASPCGVPEQVSLIVVARNNWRSGCLKPRGGHGFVALCDHRSLTHALNFGFGIGAMTCLKPWRPKRIHGIMRSRNLDPGGG